MALTSSEEALVRQLLDQQAAILSLAGNESTITSKLGATKVTLADLVAASLLADADLLLTRQGTTDKSVRADILAAYMAASSTFTNKYLAIPTMELTSVPTNKVSPIICVTQPHLRMMVWNGSQYVRAPWHQPCQLFFSYDNPASIPGALPVRADVSYQQSNYPDIVNRLGLSGVGTFTLVEARGEFLRVLDNGRGIESRALRSYQHGTLVAGELDGSGPDPQVSAMAGSNLTSYAQTWYADEPPASALTGKKFAQTSGSYGEKLYDAVEHSSYVGMTRSRNIAFPLWMTI